MIEPFDSEAGYRAAIDAILRAACRELRIFDGDLERMALDDPARNALLFSFLGGGPERRLHIALHNPGLLRTRHPRLLKLIGSHGHQLEIRQTPDHLRKLADRFVLADESHGAIRFHVDHARGKLVSDENIEIHPLWQRFDDLWEESQVCTPTVAGY
ncbi:MAG: hypothetical protein Q8O25_12775 [Sulfurisoma sp.]|nr:hypothetical protein [Sulfurisoma sp.]